MDFINQNSTIDKFIRIFSNTIDTEICNKIISNSEKYTTWETHEWYQYDTVVKSKDNTHEFLRSPLWKWDQVKIQECFNNCIEIYKFDLEKIGVGINYNGMSSPNLNKYTVDTRMTPHIDHIHSIFSGPVKGIPVLSLIAILNDDYEGGEFVFWEDYTLKLRTGDILMFPSNFLYKHRVNTVTSGTRYSIVSWIY